MSNIKVYLRIKPSDPSTHENETQNIVNSPNTKIIHQFKISPTKSGKTLSIKSDKKHFNDRRFEFEDIFEPSVGQSDLFSQFQDKIIESATNGVISLDQLLSDGIRPNFRWKNVYVVWENEYS